MSDVPSRLASALSDRYRIAGRPGGAAQLTVAELQFTPETRVLKRTMLFDASEYEPAQPHANYDVAPDGLSFVMLRRSPATHIMVIQNVQELVRRAQGTRRP